VAVANTVPEFLAGGGETGRLIAQHDWRSSELGPIEGWPQSLKTMLGFLLRSPVPLVMLWGENGIMLYNDGYSVVAGGRHPALLGSKVREGWPEVADFNDNVMRVGLAGGTLAYRDQELTLYRHGHAEQVWLDLDYSPVLDDAGRPAGVLAVVVETTERVRGEEARRETARQLDAALSVARLGTFEWNLGDDHISLDQRGRDIFGLARDSVIELATLLARIHPEDAERARAEVIASREQSSRLETEYRIIRPDRSVRTIVSISDIFPRPDGEAGRMVGVLQDITSRRRADERVRESEERFRNLADNAPVMMWVTDPDGRCTYLNKRWYEFTDLTEGESEAFGWLNPTHPNDREQVQEAFRAADVERRPFRAEYRLRRRDGVYRWVIDAATPRLGPEGVYLGYVGSVIDIEERRESEERLRLSEGRFRAAIDAIEGVLWTNDASGRMVGSQPGWERLTGQKQSDYEGYGWSSAIHPEDAQPTIDAWQAAVAERRTFMFEHRVRRHDGAWRLYAATAIPVFGADGKILEWVGVHTDISDARAAEERLRASEAFAREERDRAQSYLQVAEVMLLVLNERGTIQTINRKGAEILGYDDPAPLIGRDWFELAVPAARRAEIRSEFARLISRNGTANSFENTIRRNDGAERLIAWRNTVLQDSQGRAIGTLSSGEDVTDQREAQARERLLVQEVDHRAKNLLAVVQSVVQLTRGENIAEFKEAIAGRIQSLARTHGLLAAARWEGADLRQLVLDELAPYSRGDETRVRITGPALHLKPAAAQALALIVHELATNAAKYGALASPNGRVEIGWRTADERVRLDWSESGGPVVARPERRGFGSIVLQTSVERQLRGKVALDWKPEGLVCTLDLPGAEVLARAIRPLPNKGPIPADRELIGRPISGRRLLVLEDEALIAAQIEDVLSGAGYEVVGPAARVSEAFDRIYSDQPDAALLDINVAGERSFPVAELLRSKNVPFALCTGYGEAAIVPENLRGAPLIAKPFNTDELLRVIGTLFA
jgi:PAS domain S-box-containing protein